MKLHVSIVTPVKELLNDDVDEIIVPTITGQITILPEHIPLLTEITQGELILKKNGSTEIIVIMGGFLEVGKNRVNILADHAVQAKSISAAKALEAKERAEKILNEKSNEHDMRMANTELQKAILELKIARKLEKTI